jgi:hypothetical protein
MNRYLITLIFIFSFGTLKAQHPSPKDTFVVGKQAFCGIIFYVRTDSTTHKDSTNGRRQIWKHGLVCAMQDQSTGIAWIDSSFFVTTGATKNILFDKPNADKIIKRQGPATDYAATICRAFNTDSCCIKLKDAPCNWYLPSVVELDSMYTNLAKKNIGNFAGLGYWSSVEDTTRHNSRQVSNSAFIVDFVNRGFAEDGQTHTNEKSTLNRVRAVREFWVRISP